MKVLVTGGTGRIGAHVSRLLLERGDGVRILAVPDDPLAPRLAARGAEVRFGLLQDEAALEDAVRGVDAVVHLGAALTSRDSTDEQFFDANLRGTYNLLMAVRHHAPAVSRLVNASSDAVYWSTPDRPPAFLPIDETHPRVPGTIYGATKLGAEELCLTFWRAYGIPTTTVRFTATAEPWELVDPASVFGRRMFAAPAARALAAKARPSASEVSLLGALEELDDGTDRLFVLAAPDGGISSTNLGDARDAAAGVVALLDHPAAVGEAFNIGPAAPHTELEFVRVLAESLAVPYHVIRSPTARPSWFVSSAKARGLVGYVPRHSVFDMIDEGAASRAAARAGPEETPTPGRPVPIMPP